jgi:recombination protein RecR
VQEGQSADSLSKLRAEFEKLPSIGKKTAERLAYFVLKTPRDDALKLADAIREVKEKARHCSLCFMVTETDPCVICSSARRDQSLICVVEEPKDLERIEESGSFNGLYHVLMGHVSPLDGVVPDDLTLAQLKARVQKGGISEIIIATNPTLEGDATALAVAEALSQTGVRLSRIARGIPSGTSLEYTNKSIISDAIEGRTSFAPGGERPRP